ncbi:MAG: ATP-binding cassette domain-containing protein [Erysipelotrichaceae bacterium]|nr:ATP-binding cassette domain-containing protein [Erysipelotrichaceae bacterium]
MIVLKEVRKEYTSKKKTVEALKDVSLEIQEGEIFGIIGSSGAGKSTLLRCMNMLEKPTKGQIYIEGEELSCLKMKKLRLIRQKMGMIFQHFHLMNARTVEQNIAFPMKRKRKFSLFNKQKNQQETSDMYIEKRYTKKEIQAKTDSLLELVGLSDKKGMYPSQLSGGQKQRVAIARALANDPKVLLCDEATSALDPQTTISILKLLKEVNQKLGITIVLITHEMEVIKEICDRVAIMEGGEIVEQGSVLEIFTRPCKQVTKDFLCATSNISKIYELLEQNSPIVHLEPGDRLVKLQYSTMNTGTSIISNISKLFSLEVNIICGTIEILQNQPIGSLVVIFKGHKEKIEEAIEALKESQVEVEVMKQ